MEKPKPTNSFKDPANLPNFLAGDEQAWVAYFPELIKIITAAIPPINDRDNVVGNALLKIWNSKHTYRGESAFSSWVFRVARNTAYDAIRRRSNKKELNESETSVPSPEGNITTALEAASQGTHTDFTDPYAQVEAEIYFEQLANAHTIPFTPHEREVMELLIQNPDDTQEAYAKELNININTYKTRLHRLRQRLARHPDEL